MYTSMSPSATYQKKTATNYPLALTAHPLRDSYSSSCSYAVPKTVHCCGSFSRGQRCMGCPSR